MSTPQAFLDKAKAAANVEVKTLEGVKKYAFQLLTRREAVKVFHQSLQVVLRTVAGVDLESIKKESLSIDGIAKALADRQPRN